MYTNDSAYFYKPNLFYATRSSMGGGRFAPEWCVNVIWHLTLTSIIAHIN